MLQWEDFDDLRVIKKLKDIIRQWWNVEVFFVDENSEIRGFDKHHPKLIKNSVLNMIMNKSVGYDLLQKFCKELSEVKKQTSFDSCFWEIGFKAFVSPVYFDQTFFGLVVATGFFTQQTQENEKEKLYKTLRDFGYNSAEIEAAIEEIKIIPDNQLVFCTELVSLVASEVETLNEEIFSREEKILELNKELGTRYRYDNMIGKSTPMQTLYTLLDKIKNSSSSVLIEGENGTGKELIAKAIHYNSTRKNKIFVAQNCSAFNDNLLESELFGHTKGSFTGAVKDKKGLFEIADGGTFFLDEIGDMSLAMQVKILRVLQEGTFIPVGSTDPKKVDVRIIAATNRDLKEMILKGEFREDLYYRINVININVPPLRARQEDIPLLTDFFLEKASKETGSLKKKLSKKLLVKMMEYRWPGNIRELENEVERLVVLTGDDNIIDVDLLSPRMNDVVDKKSVNFGGKLKDSIEELEKDLIEQGLKKNNWNKSKLAKELGISRASLISKVEKYELEKRKGK